MAMKKRDESQVEVWDKFDKFMAEQGYRILVHNDHYMGRGSVACKDDKFALIFNLHVWGGEIADNFVSIHIEDRNGNAILDGPIAAIYSMADTGDGEKNLLIFSKMLNDAYEKYGGYSKTNRLDFVFNEMKQDRRAYDEMILLSEEGMKDSLEDSKDSKSVDELIRDASSVSKESGQVLKVKDFDLNKE